MKKSRFTEQQIALILKQVDDGLGVDERSGSGNLNNGVWFYKWIPALVMPPP